MYKYVILFIISGQTRKQERGEGPGVHGEGESIGEEKSQQTQLVFQWVDPVQLLQEAMIWTKMEKGQC
jgi:hypothetical protein